MPRFPIESSQITDNKAKISGDDFKHISKVLRLGVDDQIILFDELYNEHTGKIVSVNNKELEVEIYNSNKNTKDPQIFINLYQAVPKGSKIDLIIQKTTELGVKSITPIRTERSIVQDSRKSGRWSKISVEACKQCGRSEPPVINNFIEYRNITENIRKNDLTLLFYENHGKKLKSFLENELKEYNTINIIIGPEGGFTAGEIVFAENNGISIVGLGPRILKVETASIAAVTAIQYHYGDI